MSGADMAGNTGERSWYFAINGQRVGPYGRDQIQALIGSGAFGPETPVWSAPMPDWAPLAMTELAAFLPGGAPPAAPPPTAAPGHLGGVGAGDAADIAGNHAAPPRDFIEAITTCLRLYVGFTGRASRSEYWYFTLFGTVVSIAAAILDVVFVDPSGALAPFNMVASLALLLPSLAVGVRRLHDIGRSGWWFFIALVPLAGFVVLIVFFCTPGVHRATRYDA